MYKEDFLVFDHRVCVVESKSMLKSPINIYVFVFPSIVYEYKHLNHQKMCLEDCQEVYQTLTDLS